MKEKPEQIEEIKAWWAKAGPGYDDPGEVANKAMDDIPILLSALEAARVAKKEVVDTAIKLFGCQVDHGTEKMSFEDFVAAGGGACALCLKSALESARAKLSEAEKARDTWEHALKCRDHQFREFMDKWEEATGFTETLKEKLESAQEENRRLREALEELWAAHGVVVSANGYSGAAKRHIEPAIYKCKKVLARPEKEGGG